LRKRGNSGILYIFEEIDIKRSLDSAEFQIIIKLDQNIWKILSTLLNL